MTGYPQTELIDAAYTREHIHALRAAGVTLRNLAAASQVPLGTVAAISQGRRSIVTRTNATAILAVKTTVTGPPEGFVHATKPRRQGQALYRIGYDTTQLHHHTGIPRGVVWKIISGSNPYVSARHAAAIDRAYRTLSYIPGPSPQCRDIGARKHWASPLAWDTDTIGDPNARPDTGGRSNGPIIPDTVFINLALGGDREIAVKLRFVDRRQAYKTAAERGIPKHVAAERLAPSERSYFRAVAGSAEPVAA